MNMFNKRELEMIKWALYGELKRSKEQRDKPGLKHGLDAGWAALHHICSDIQRLIDKTIKILAGEGER